MSHEPLLNRVRSLLKGRHCEWSNVGHLWHNMFYEVGQGGCKITMAHPEFPGWVVKLFKHRRYFRRDHSSLGYIVPELVPFWLPNAYVCNRFAIQVRADGVGGTQEEASKIIRAALEGKPNWDRHAQNAAFHQGKPVLLDYSLHWEDLPKTPKRVTLTMTVI